MVAFNRIHCTVIAVEVSDFDRTRGALAREVLPWADPYVAQLIRNLQDEVREERRAQRGVRHYRPERSGSGSEALRLDNRFQRLGTAG